MFQFNRQLMRFNDKLYIVKKTINGERIEDLELAKEYYKMTPILYSDYFFYKVYLKKKNNIYPIWLYLNESSYMEPSFNDPNCIFWQYKQDMKISNFQEEVDFNVFLGDSSEFYKLLKK